MGMDFFGGGGATVPTSKEFGRSSAEATIGGDTRTVGLDSTTLLLLAAIAAVALVLSALIFRR